MAQSGKVSVGSIPAEALSKGALNEGVGPEAKQPKETKVTHEGPHRGSQGEFLKATYPVKNCPHGTLRSDH